MFEVEISGRKFLVCTKPTDEEDRFLGEWYAWCFFAYDHQRNIYPADSIPDGVETQESIAGEFGDTEETARKSVENVLRRVLETKSLDGTGFYSPPGGLTFPQDRFPPEYLGNEPG